jgi:hypothetical protein
MRFMSRCVRVFSEPYTLFDGVILNGLQAVKDLARSSKLQARRSLRFAQDASQAQHDVGYGGGISTITSLCELRKL